MDKRKIVKMIAQTVVTTAIGSAITKTLSTKVPPTQKLKMAEMSGTFGGWLIGEKLQPRIDKVIDDFFDRREARKS